MTEALDLFPKSTWVTRADHEHKEATELFRAAVMSARSGNDDSIKQVRLLLSWFILGFYFPVYYMFLGTHLRAFFPLIFSRFETRSNCRVFILATLNLNWI